VTILSLSGTRLKSPTQPQLTEWTACSRPLGVWACIWVVRALLACGLTYWGFLRERKAYVPLCFVRPLVKCFVSRQHRHTEEGASAGASTSPNVSSPSATGTTISVGARTHRLPDPSTPADSTEHPPLPYTRLYSRSVSFPLQAVVR
jgi:hypothetical protein